MLVIIRQQLFIQKLVSMGTILTNIRPNIVIIWRYSELIVLIFSLLLMIISIITAIVYSNIKSIEYLKIIETIQLLSMILLLLIMTIHLVMINGIRTTIDTKSNSNNNNSNQLILKRSNSNETLSTLELIKTRLTTKKPLIEESDETEVEVMVDSDFGVDIYNIMNETDNYNNNQTIVEIEDQHVSIDIESQEQIEYKSKSSENEKSDSDHNDEFSLLNDSNTIITYETAKKQLIMNDNNNSFDINPLLQHDWSFEHPSSKLSSTNQSNNLTNPIIDGPILSDNIFIVLLIILTILSIIIAIPQLIEKNYIVTFILASFSARILEIIIVILFLNDFSMKRNAWRYLAVTTIQQDRNSYHQQQHHQQPIALQSTMSSFRFTNNSNSHSKGTNKRTNQTRIGSNIGKFNYSQGHRRLSSIESLM